MNLSFLSYLLSSQYNFQFIHLAKFIADDLTERNIRFSGFTADRGPALNPGRVCSRLFNTSRGIRQGARAPSGRAFVARRRRCKSTVGYPAGVADTESLTFLRPRVPGRRAFTRPAMYVLVRSHAIDT